MPNIRTFEAPENLGLNPTDRGTDATAAAARRVGAFYNQVGGSTQDLGHATQHLGAQTGQLGSAKKAMWDSLADNAASDIRTVGGVITKNMDHREVSHGSAVGTELASSLDTAWNTVAKGGKDAAGNVIPPADPNDPSVRQKFLQEQVEPALEKFKEGFTTENSQAWAEQFSDNLRSHLSTKSAADMATNAGTAAVENVHRTTNNLASMVAGDPSSLDFALKQYRLAVHASVDSSPMINNTQAASIKADLRGEEGIVKSAIIGMIQKNPNIDLDAIQKRYGEFLKAGEMGIFQRAAQTQAKANALTDRALQKAQREEVESKATAAISKIWTDNVTYGPDDKARVNPGVINKLLDVERNAPGAATTEIKSMIAVVQKEIDGATDAPRAVSAATTNDLLSRIRAQDDTRLTSNEEIYKAKIAGKLSNTDFKFLQDEYNNARTPEGAKLGARTEDFVKAIAPMIDKSNPLLGKIDPSGKEGVYRFQVDLMRKIDQYRKAGKDPYDLLDPTKPDYMGSPVAISPYQIPLSQSIQNTAQRLRTGGGLPAPDTITGVKSEPAPVATSVPRPPAAKPPEKGFVKDGWEFLGGNAGEARNWRKVGA